METKFLFLRSVLEVIGAIGHPLIASITVGVLAAVVTFASLKGLAKMPKDQTAVVPSVNQDAGKDSNCANWVNVGSTASCSPAPEKTKSTTDK